MLLNASEAVLFPGWTRLGPAGSGGIEMMGQSMLSMVAMALGFMVLIIIPVAVGAGAFYALRTNVTAAGRAGRALLRRHRASASESC